MMFQYNHNEHYADLLLHQVPSHCQNALDIGCGDGSLVRRLADRFSISVTGIDANHAIITKTQKITGNTSIQFIEADFMQYHFDEQFDFISASASLHHMPFDQSLGKMASLLRSGGVLAVLGLFREASPLDIGVDLVAIPVNAFYALSHKPSFSSVPTKAADMSLQQIRESISSNLPNAYLRRLLLWRYLLRWQKP